MNTTDTTKQVLLSSAVSATRDPSPLEIDAETFYHMGMQAMETASDYLEAIPQKPVIVS